MSQYLSPVSDHPAALPTPPFSPHALLDPFAPTRNLLDSLVAFYHQERMWVYRTRASLELSFDSDPAPQSPPLVKTELVSPPIAAPTLLTRRKKTNFKLRLDGISTRDRPKPRPARPQGQPETGVQILELFENMMEARMESCQRVNKLVRKANRADLYVR